MQDIKSHTPATCRGLDDLPNELLLLILRPLGLKHLPALARTYRKLQTATEDTLYARVVLKTAYLPNLKTLVVHANMMWSSVVVDLNTQVLENVEFRHIVTLEWSARSLDPRLACLPSLSNAQELLRSFT